MLEEPEEVPEWLAHLERPKIRQLAHEYGAGAPCTACTFCPGLQLHFWRKRCTLCGCHLEDHFVAGDGYPQYQIVFGPKQRRKTVLPFQGEETAFDWVPLLDDPSVIEEYMASLPKEWRPIAGSLGGRYRKKQLGRQLPRYDVDPSSCLPLEADEAMRFNEYQTSMRQNAAGLGSVQKLDGIYRASPAWVLGTATSEPVHLNPLLANTLRHSRGVDEGITNGPLATHCRRCEEPLQGSGVVVKAAKVNQAAWHAGCFLCSTCGELLVDLHYFYHDGNIYCGRDYAQAVHKPRCSACDELIFEKEYACAEGRFYHNSHFCCSICDELLGGKQYLYKNDTIICPSCYQNKFPKTCVSCKQVVPLYEQRLEVGKNIYHKSVACFRCAVCQCSLEGSRVFTSGSVILCSPCFSNNPP